MGTKTDEYLASLLNDSFKREVDSDEAVWRSLPFFGAVLGLAIALLPQIYRSATEVAGFTWRLPVYLLLALSILCFMVAAGWFWVVIRTRLYRYPPTDLEILNYAEALRAFHKNKGIADRDETVRDELRAFILDEFARTTTNNRRNNTAKLRARSQVLLFAMAGFLIAFFCEVTILASQAFSPVSKEGNGGPNGRGSSDYTPERQGAPTRRAGPSANSAGAAMGQGGGELLRASEKKEGGAQGMSDAPTPTPTPAPPPPERPGPEWLKKDQTSRPREHR